VPLDQVHVAPILLQAGGQRQVFQTDFSAYRKSSHLANVGLSSVCACRKVRAYIGRRS
jgi:hypothetical protein